MLRVRLLFFSTSIFLILFSSCRIKRDFSPLSPGVKEWASFRTGSYWICQNDSSGTLDSVFVGFNGTDTYPSSDNTYDVETVNTTLTNSSEDLLGYIFGVGFKEIVFQDFSFDPEYEVSAGFDLEGDSIIEETIEVGYYSCIITKADNLTINNTLYEDVVRIKVNPLTADGQVNRNIVFNYWIAKNQWIIKKTYNNNGEAYSWSVLRNNIVQ